MIKWYGESKEYTFKPCHEINTGGRAINGMKVIDVPTWVSSRIAIGQEFSFKNIDGLLHWYIEGVEVTEPQSPDPTQP